MNYTDYILASSEMLKANGVKNLQYDNFGQGFSKIARGYASPYTGVNTNLFNQNRLGYGFKYNMMY